ncbi:family S53 protease-like protein [Gautieria morchelliformis]|nr:family S53 protease-like protein [Gautieria morchelliformis]
MVLTSLVVASLVTLACAGPVAQNLVVHEQINSAPNGFLHTGPASDSTVLNLRIALVSSDMAGLEKALYDVSTPSSSLYGQHLSKADVEAFVAPKPETVSAVNGWINANGLSATTISPAGDWLALSIPVSKANSLLGAQFSFFTEQATGKESVHTLSYSIPASLKGHIELIHPTTSFASSHSVPKFSTPTIVPPRNVTSSLAVPSSCASVVTPACLQALYGIPTTQATQSSNALGVSGFIDQFAQTADLKQFLRTLRPDLPQSTTFALKTLDGGSNPQGAQNAGDEANLDIQYTVGVASGVPVTFISVGDNFRDGDLEGFLDIINALLAESSPPQVLTTSYGNNEDEISPNLAMNLCNAYMQLGARGTSILFASGDGGVTGSQTSSCSTFVPTFPSGCPFLTSVGATTGIGPETAASFSSGGFSNVFAAPSYQTAAVSSFLSTLGNTNRGLFNRTGRGFPDISAQGVNVEIVSGGSAGTVSGTSCSSPIFASVISLLNDRLIAKGKSPLGFLNPFLYSSAGRAALNDVTSGSNPGCNTNGFPATTGWDPVTGLGTPNFAALASAVGA